MEGVSILYATIIMYVMVIERVQSDDIVLIKINIWYTRAFVDPFDRS